MYIFRKMKYLKQIIWILIFLNFIIINSHSNELADTIEINDWKILFEQRDSLENVKKSPKWQNIKIPKMFKHPYGQKGKFQFVWLKGEFNIPKNPESYYGISIRHVYQSNKIYVNDKIVGERKPRQCRQIHEPVHYTIPVKTLKKGRNEVYIYLGIYGNKKGGISGKVLLQPKKMRAQELRLTLTLNQ